MLLKSYLTAVVLTFGLASGAHAAAVTINGPHASLDCTTCHANGQFKAPAKETCFQCHQSYQTVAERTAKMNPNPHSNHRGALLSKLKCGMETVVLRGRGLLWAQFGTV